MTKRTIGTLLLLAMWGGTVFGQPDPVREIINRHYASLENLYKHFHQNPELSLYEEETSARLAEELRAVGFSVTERVGGYGIINRIGEKLKAAGISAGLPEQEWPQLVLNEDTRVSSVYNDPELGERLRNTFAAVLGEEKVHETEPFMYGEDFGEYHHARPGIPAVLFGVGSISPEDMAAARAGEKEIASTHSPEYLPDVESTMKTGILAMSSAVLDLMKRTGHE